jgi:hypothetical protein
MWRRSPSFSPVIKLGKSQSEQNVFRLLAHDSANPSGSITMTPEQRAEIHVEPTTVNLDVLYEHEHLKATGVVFFEPLTMSPESVT